MSLLVKLETWSNDPAKKECEIRVRFEVAKAWRAECLYDLAEKECSSLLSQLKARLLAFLDQWDDVKLLLEEVTRNNADRPERIFDGEKSLEQLDPFPNAPGNDIKSEDPTIIGIAVLVFLSDEPLAKLYVRSLVLSNEITIASNILMGATRTLLPWRFDEIKKLGSLKECMESADDLVPTFTGPDLELHRHEMRISALRRCVRLYGLNWGTLLEHSEFEKALRSSNTPFLCLLL